MQYKIKMGAHIIAIHKTLTINRYDKPKINKKRLSLSIYKSNERKTESKSNVVLRFYISNRIYSEVNSWLYCIN